MSTLRSVAAKAGAFSVEEMAETALSMSMMGVRGDAMAAATDKIENEFLKEVVQDGVGAGFSVLSSAMMAAEQKVVEATFNRFGSVALGIALAGKNGVRTFARKFRKGRKASMMGRAVSSLNLTTEDARLVADFGAMNVNGRSSVVSPSASQDAFSMTVSNNMQELQSEKVRTMQAGMALTTMKDSFEIKLKSSSFLDTDKPLIKKVLRVEVVTDEMITMLNSYSRASVFKDTSGNYIGTAQAQTELLLGLRLQ